MKYTKFTGLCMIWLIVMFPFYIADVYAANVVSITPYGEDSIPGIRKAVDSLTVDVVADSDVSPVVRIIQEPTVSFTCQEVGVVPNRYNCTTTVPSFLNTKNSISFTIQLFSSANQPTSPPTPTSITTDSIGPSVSFSVLSKKGDTLELSVQASDIACSAAECAGKCSGFSSLDVTIDGSKKASLTNKTTACTIGKTTLVPKGAGLIPIRFVKQVPLPVLTRQRFHSKELLACLPLLNPLNISTATIIDCLAKNRYNKVKSPICKFRPNRKHLDQPTKNIPR